MSTVQMVVVFKVEDGRQVFCGAVGRKRLMIMIPI